MDKEKIIEILRKHVQVIHKNGQTYSFSLYFDKVAEDISNQIDCRVKPEIAVDVINKEIAGLEKLAKEYASEGYIESYIDCLSNRNVLKNILTKIEKQFSV